jgi:hypothetical protein
MAVSSSHPASFAAPPERSSRPRNRLPTTSRLSQSARSWYTVAIPSDDEACGPFRDTGRPSKSTWPSSMGMMPEMILMRVDFPAPLSPTRATTSPGRTSKSTAVSA